MLGSAPRGPSTQASDLATTTPFRWRAGARRRRGEIGEFWFYPERTSALTRRLSPHASDIALCLHFAADRAPSKHFGGARLRGKAGRLIGSLGRHGA